MTNRKRIALLIAVLVAGCGLAIFAAMGQASTAEPSSKPKPSPTARPAAPVEIVAHTVFVNERSAFESDLAGCEAGTVVDGPGKVHDTPGGGVYNGDKEFTCAGGEAGFTVTLKARFGEDGSTGSWNVKAGWGQLDGLKGSGSLVGTPTDAGIDDVYTGTVR
jgi:hypothetical protein